MARTVEEIQNKIIAYKEAESELSSLSSTSRRAIWRLITYVVAQAQNLLEQVWDAKKVEIEAQVASTPAWSGAWVQAQMFLFQYDSTTTQYIELDTTTYSYKYPTVNADLRIITRCSVVSEIDNVVYIKVAKGTTPTALVTAEINAAQSYIDAIGSSSVTYTVQSTDSDKLYLEGSIYYQGQYSADIETLVESAINTYLSGLPFDGKVKVSGLIKAIRDTEGVNDVQLTNIAARADATAFANRSFLVQSSSQLSTEWQTKAGYIVEETTSGETFGDKLTYVAQ